jgi:hypothetical protein
MKTKENKLVMKQATYNMAILILMLLLAFWYPDC